MTDKITENTTSIGIIDTIIARRSIRRYTEAEVPMEDIHRILEAGRWAPSGMNNQPWKFIVIQKRESIEKIAGYTKYGHIMRQAPLLIAVYMDTPLMYNRTKDLQAVGAAIQNMLLACCEIGLGAVWLGEILNNKDKVNLILSCPESLELMAILAIGHPAEEGNSSSRKEQKEICYAESYACEWV